MVNQINRKYLIVGITVIVISTIFIFSKVYVVKVDDTGWTQQGVQEVVNANNQFAFDLYSKLSRSENENVFFSPYSISTALAMAYEGAKGQTAKEIKSVFHFPERSVLEPNFAKTYNEINEGNNAYELRTGNALWVQKDFPFLKDYTNRVERYYGGKATNLDFIRETEKSRQTINKFIEEQTNNKIKNLIPEGAIDSMTRLVITNAIYFKGIWKRQFDKKETEERDFYITPTKVVKVPMMYMSPEKTKFNYTETDKLQILELPYKGDKISMFILLPKQNYTLKDIEKNLTYKDFENLKKQMHETKLDAIYIPKFEFKTKYILNENLKDLGMPSAFNMSSADFSGMTTAAKLWIGSVIHQAYIKADEKGTEAAAATGVVMKLEAVPGSPKVFKADHPFVFIIQDKETGDILFMGRVTNPTKD